jgi:hypothetical protein
MARGGRKGEKELVIEVLGNVVAFSAAAVAYASAFAPPTHTPAVATGCMSARLPGTACPCPGSVPAAKREGRKRKLVNFSGRK